MKNINGCFAKGITVVIANLVGLSLTITSLSLAN